jgi:hypothetical protein
MLATLRQRRRTISACVLPALLFAWCVAAAGVCPHGHGEGHAKSHADEHVAHDLHDLHDHYDHGGHHHVSGHGADHTTGDDGAARDDCDREFCPNCAAGPRAGSDAVLSFCAVCVADGAAPTGPGHQIQMDPDEPSAQAVLFPADVRPDRRSRGQRPPDPAVLPQPVPINLRHCVFLN